MKYAFVAGSFTAIALAWAPSSSFAGGATGGVVVGGDPVATISGQGTSLTTINQSANQAIINWQQFSIGAGDTVKFVQPSANAIALNRVLGGDLTQIYGTLQANGKVIVINPNGIMVGPGGMVDTKGFIASTLDVPDNQFLSGGPMLFSGKSTAAVNNQGTIRALGGDVFLIAHTVDNSGTISAPQGTVGLAAGSQIELVPSGDERISVLAGDPSSPAAIGVNNTGAIAAASAELKAAGGNIYALAINNGGVVRATAIVSENGHIYLRAAGGNIQNSGTLAAQNADGSGGSIVLDGGDNLANPSAVINSGTIDASGTIGGTVEMLGDNVGLFDNALVNVSGAAGGGTALIGGDLHGANPNIQDAEHTFISPTATINADAIAQGNGGEIVLWSDNTTRDYGTLSATGGATGGNGGYAEVSSKGVVDFAGVANLTAPAGNGGTLLFDPASITISTAAAANITGFSPPGDIQEAFTDDGNSASIFQLTGNPATSSFGGVGNGVTIDLQAKNNITVANTFDIATETGNNNVSLDLQAGNNINVNAAITASGTGSITLSANDNGGGTASGTGSVNISLSGALTTSGGAINVSGVGITVGSFGINATGSTANNGGNVILNATGALALNAPVFSQGGTASTVGLNGGNVQLTGATITSTGGSVNTSGSAAANGAGGTAGTITVTSGGAITIGNLTANGGAGAGNVGGDAAEISITGGNTITLNNSLSALGGAGTSSGNNSPISLHATVGGVSQSAGSLQSSGLQLLGAGTFNLTDNGNAVGTLAANVTGSLQYQDSAPGSAPLTVGTVLGTVGLTSANNPIQVSTANSGLTIANNVNAGSATATFTAGGAGNQLTMNPSVSITANGGVNLFADNMSIDSTAAILAGASTVTLAPFGNGVAINLGGPDGIATLGLTSTELGRVTAGTLQVGNATTGPITVVAPVLAPGTVNTFSLQGSSISQSAGNTLTSITPTVLNLQSAGPITLNAANAVDILSISGGGVQFTDDNSLSISSINDPGQTVTLTAGSPGITLGETGFITAGQLNLKNWGTTTLNQANQVAVLSVTGATAALQYTTGAPTLSILGIADPSSTVTINGSGAPTVTESGSISATQLVLNNLGTTTLTGANQVPNLNVTGGLGALQYTTAGGTLNLTISDPGQSVTFNGTGSTTLNGNPISAGTLVLNNFGAVNLTAANQVGVLKGTGLTGTFQFTDAQNLDVQGLSASGQTVTLTGNNADNLNETAGTLTAGQLNLNNWVAVTMNKANQVGVLTASSPGTGGFQFSMGAGTTDVQGISDAGQTVTLSGNGAGSIVTESIAVGFINAGELDLNNLGNTTLNQQNTVGIFKILSSAGTTQFTDNHSLDVQGISAAGRTVTLTGNPADTLSESTGTITAGQLNLNNWSTVTLNQGNQAAILTAAGLAGTFQYNTASTLDIQNLADPAFAVTLSSTGFNTVNQTAGAINTIQLNLQNLGTTTLNQPNIVGSLQVTAPGGALQFTDAQSLNVQNVIAPSQNITLAVTGDNNELTVAPLQTITSGNVTLTADRVNIAGTISTPGTATIAEGTAGRQITIGTDDVSAPTASGGTLGLTTAELNNITAATLRVGDATSGNLAVTTILAPFSFPTLFLQSGGTVSENPGTSITIGSLAAKAGSISLVTGNSVGNFAAFTPGMLNFVNAGSLTIGNDGGLVGIQAGGGANVTTQTGTLTVSSAIASPSGVTLSANDMSITAPINSGGANTIFEPFTAGISANFGGPIAGDLNLTQAELNQVTANVLQIGNSLSGAPVNAQFVVAPLTVHQLLILGGNSSITLLSQQLAALSAVETPTPTEQVTQFSSASLSQEEISKILPAGAIGTIWLQLPFPHEEKRTFQVEDVSKWTSGPMAAVGSTAGPQSPR